uniref:Thioredoxin domain-containing protein n=1 Tax=Lotharella globosa TaxID=91324 RepID=A0A7S3ZAB5_9EUKA|mmetsp:Transcript_19709/g.37981  ORF Transcript_19709/g.37981 Transcript_19709/m.37981 type:complete len:241 (+) Transcript_19709:2-724(+)
MGPPKWKKSDVIVLTGSTWRQETKNPKTILLVAFYSNKDRLMSQHQDGYKEVASKLKGYAKICVVNCDEQPDLCKQQSAKIGATTIKLYPYRAHDKPIAFRSSRPTTKGLYNFVAKNIPSFVKVLVTARDASSFAETNKNNVKIILVSTKDKVSVLYKSLSKDFRKQFNFAQITQHNTRALKALNKAGLEVKTDGKLPAVFVYIPSMQTTRRYPGRLTHDELHKYLNTLARKLARFKSEL